MSSRPEAGASRPAADRTWTVRPPVATGENAWAVSGDLDHADDGTPGSPLAAVPVTGADADAVTDARAKAGER